MVKIMYSEKEAILESELGNARKVSQKFYALGFHLIWTLHEKPCC